MIELNETERTYLKGLLEKSQERLLHELHHASTHDFKDRLKSELTLVEGLSKKVSG